jgi:hypothetical protein
MFSLEGQIWGAVLDFVTFFYVHSHGDLDMILCGHQVIMRPISLGNGFSYPAAVSVFWSFFFRGQTNVSDADGSMGRTYESFWFLILGVHVVLVSALDMPCVDVGKGKHRFTVQFV